MSENTTQHRRRALQAGLWLGLLLTGTGCSFHSSFQTGTATGEGSSGGEHESARAQHEHKVLHAPPVDHDCTPDNPRCVAARQKAADDLARVDRETADRVAEAERDAAAQEKAAEEEAERQRQQAQAEAEQKQRDADAAAAAQAQANKPKVMRRAEPSGTVFHNGPDASQPSGMNHSVVEVLERRKGEINASTDEKKAAIRKQLDQNKADILVAAERKRNEIHAQLKQDATAQP